MFKAMVGSLHTLKQHQHFMHLSPVFHRKT